MSGPLARLLVWLRPQARALALAAALQALTIAAGMGLLGASAWLLAQAALHPSIAALQLAIVGVRAFGIGRAVLRYLERLVSHDAALRVLARLRSALFRALAPLAPAGLLAHRGGDLLSRALDDVATLEGFSVRLLGPSLAAIGVAVLLFVLLRPFGAPLALAGIAGLVLAGAAAPALVARLAAAPGARVAERRGSLAAQLADGVQGAGELLVFGAEVEHVARVDAVARDFSREQERLVRASALGGALAGLLADLTLLAVLALAVVRVRDGALAAVQIAPLALLTLAAFEAVAALPLAWQGLASQRASARRLFELIDAEPPVPEAAAELPDDRPAKSEAEEPLLAIRALRFCYPGETRAALDGVDLSLGLGRRVALVGPSGSGKSTLAHLLLRFWDVEPGAIRFAGRELHAQSAEDVRAQIAFAAQQSHVFAGTLRENLLLGRPDASAEDLLGVVRAVGLDALIRQLPDGLDSWVGEDGRRLSGGERQRLALARALLQDAPLLLLDEPTAHLDAFAERAILAEILRAGTGRATLLVTHRLVGLEAFDEVVVLDAGRVVERGRASELVGRDGFFARGLARQRQTATLADSAFGLASDPEAPRVG